MGVHRNILIFSKVKKYRKSFQKYNPKKIQLQSFCFFFKKTLKLETFLQLELWIVSHKGSKQNPPWTWNWWALLCLKLLIWEIDNKKKLVLASKLACEIMNLDPIVPLKNPDLTNIGCYHLWDNACKFCGGRNFKSMVMNFLVIVESILYKCFLGCVLTFCAKGLHQW